MLFCLADHEVGLAERAAELQRPYRSPNRWSLKQLAWTTFLPDMPPPSKQQYAYVIDHALVRFNPSRAILGLEQRGFVKRDHYSRHRNLALTVEGFAEARRLGGVTDSEIVDLDRVAANWRDPADFALGLDDLWRDDGPPPDYSVD
jgi:hypothetical protein